MNRTSHDDDIAATADDHRDEKDTMTDHKTEAEQAAKNGKYDIAQYHATMYHAEQVRLGNLIVVATRNDALLLDGELRRPYDAPVDLEVERNEVDGWFLEVRKGLGL